MTMKTETIIYNVRGDELPVAWAKKLEMDINIEGDELVDIVIRPTYNTKQRKASWDEILATAKRLQDAPVVNPDFSEDDLYDEIGAPR